MLIERGGMISEIVSGKVRKVVTVQAILEWTFGREHARIRTDPHERLEGVTATGVDTIWVMMKRKELGGIRIDTSPGRSSPHDDAEIVAAIVENLPSNVGGIGMAIRVAELARAGLTPDWMPEARTRVVPKEWRQCKHGTFARTEVVGTVKYRHRGRIVCRDVTVCPVTYHPSAAKIAAARRDYLDWWGALLEIRSNLACVALKDHVLSDVMPPMEPWKRVAGR